MLHHTSKTWKRKLTAEELQAQAAKKNSRYVRPGTNAPLDHKGLVPSPRQDLVGRPDGAKQPEINFGSSRDDGLHRVNSTDLSKSGGSASSLASTASSISSIAQPTMSHASNGLDLLTPLTNTDLSPQNKALSPPATKSALDLELNGHVSPYGTIVDQNDEVIATITQVRTPPETRIQALPGPGEWKGERIIWDPERLSAEERKKLPKGVRPRYKEFGLEVRVYWRMVLRDQVSQQFSAVHSITDNGLTISYTTARSLRAA